MSAPPIQRRYNHRRSSTSRRQQQCRFTSLLHSSVSKIGALFSIVLIELIKLYQWLISPVLGSHCRYYPSCSEYVKQALKEHGIVRGCFLMIKRLGRCHPYCQGGIDLVPRKKVK